MSESGSATEAAWLYLTFQICFSDSDTLIQCQITLPGFWNSNLFFLFLAFSLSLVFLFVSVIKLPPLSPLFSVILD